MFDVGTRPDDYTIPKLYQLMLMNERIGAVAGEKEVEIESNNSIISYFLQLAQFYEYK